MREGSYSLLTFRSALGIVVPEQAREWIPLPVLSYSQLEDKALNCRERSYTARPAVTLEQAQMKYNSDTQAEISLNAC